MSLRERVSGAHIFHTRALKEADPVRQEVSGGPVFSEAFQEQMVKQHAFDERLGALSPTGSPKNVGYGQDCTVSLVATTEGPYVVKKFKPTSRANLIYGLGILAGEVPPDTDIPARQALVNRNRGREVDPKEVADKIRLTHAMAMVHLDQGDHIILPTATLVVDGEVQNRQRYLPEFETVMMMPKHPREAALEIKAKADLFRRLTVRWDNMRQTPDFKQLPPDVQDFWNTFPPDSGYGSNAKFMGLGHVKAIDY